MARSTCRCDSQSESQTRRRGANRDRHIAPARRGDGLCRERCGGCRHRQRHLTNRTDRFADTGQVQEKWLFISLMLAAA